MKRIHVLLMILLTGFTAYGQYGHRLYYADSVSNDWLNDGLITRNNLTGGEPVYVAAGRTLPAQAGSLERSRFVRARLGGTVQNNRKYFVFRNGIEISSRLNSITEGSSYLMLSGSTSGSASLPLAGGSDILMMKASAAGVPTHLFKIDLGGGADEAFCTRRSNKSASSFYTCGISSLQGQGRAFLMKHNNTLSSISWVRSFTLPCLNGAQGNAEAVAVLDDSLSNTVVVVGNVKSTAGCQRAFIAKFSSTGTLRWLRFVTASNAGDMEFTSIRGTGVSDQYLLTGQVTLPNLNKRVLLLRVDASGNNPVTVFAKALYSTGPTPNYIITNQYGYDVVTRIKSGAKEYYVCGANQYSNTLTDGLIFKTDSTGTPLAERLYSGFGREQFNAIDVYPAAGAAGAGFAAFGRFDRIVSPGAPTRSQAWLAKGYFNLVTGCNELADNPQSMNLSIQYTTQGITTANTFTKDTLTSQNTTVLNTKLCWATTVAGGSNARLGAEQEEEQASAEVEPGSALSVRVFPNPAGEEQTTLRLSVAQDEEVLIRMVDAMGRVAEEFTAILTAGVSEIQLDTEGLARGVYLIQVHTSGGQVESTRLIRQ